MSDVRLLTVTSLYPSAARPRHGIFVESRLLRLLARGGVSAQVIAPVPWFPFGGARWGEYGRFAATPQHETRSGVPVEHPRYVTLPRIGMRLQPVAFAHSVGRVAGRLMKGGARYDLVDAHYLYPDGVAAAAVASQLGLPYVLSARGSDVNVIAQMPGPRRRILAAIEGAAAVIAVSSALKSALMGLGVAAERITVLRNGVDPKLFFPEDRDAARRELQLPPAPAAVVCSVGNLVPGKRHDLALRAVLDLPEAHFVVVGRGAEAPSLRRLARDLGAEHRVRFFDEMPQEKLRALYSAADALVLASQSEGWPNVLLESMACGTPTVAFAVGGVPEILIDPNVARLVRERPNAASLAGALRHLLDRPPPRDAVRNAALRFSWAPILEAQLALYRRVAHLGRGARVTAGDAQAANA